MLQTRYTNPFRYQGTHCANLLLRCIDPRFHAALEQALAPRLLQVSGSSAFASMALPGGAKAVLDPTVRPVVFQALDTAIRALETSRLIIADHADCRACGGSEQHGDPQDETRFHVEQLRRARQVVTEAYPRLEIMIVYVDWDKITEVEG